MINDQLSREQKEELQEVLTEFVDSLHSIPGRTMLAEHQIDVGSAHPIKIIFLPTDCHTPIGKGKGGIEGDGKERGHRTLK